MIDNLKQGVRSLNEAKVEAVEKTKGMENLMKEKEGEKKEEDLAKTTAPATTAEKNKQKAKTEKKQEKKADTTSNAKVKEAKDHLVRVEKKEDGSVEKTYERTTKPRKL